MNQNDYIKMNHCDILWVDDFDGSYLPYSKSVTSDKSDKEICSDQLQYYFHQDYHFRVDIYKYFLKLLLHLEDENNFSRYSCVVLDIDLRSSGWASPKPGDNKRPTSTKEEVELIIKKLKDNKVVLRNEHYSIDSNGKKKVKIQDFYKNAGYYLYLYLLQKGMPADRICMLTANGGDVDVNDDGNTCGNQSNVKQSTAKKWKGIFNEAGLSAPKDYDRREIESTITQNKDGNNPFKSWLDGKFSDQYLFRSCVVAMSGCLLEMIEREKKNKNGIKLRQFWKQIWKEDKVGLESVTRILENVRKLPLRFSNKIEKEYINIIWQLVSPWEANLNLPINNDIDNTYPRAYYNLLKTTRNCLAHLSITELNLQITAFLFGLSLRGLFDFTSIDNSVNDGNVYKEYKDWEKTLLNLLERQEEKIEPNQEKDFSELVLESFKDINNRLSNNTNNFSFNTDVALLIRNSLEKNEKIKGTDFLLRSFLHGINPICFDKSNDMNHMYKEKYNNFSKKIEYLEVKLEAKVENISNQNPKEYEIAIEYLKRVRTTLQKSIQKSIEDYINNKK